FAPYHTHAVSRYRLTQSAIPPISRRLFRARVRRTIRGFALLPCSRAIPRQTRSKRSGAGAYLLWTAIYSSSAEWFVAGEQRSTSELQHAIVPARPASWSGRAEQQRLRGC